jgi:hypothetical protein
MNVRDRVLAPDHSCQRRLPFVTKSRDMRQPRLRTTQLNDARSKAAATMFQYFSMVNVGMGVKEERLRRRKERKEFEEELTQAMRAMFAG